MRQALAFSIGTLGLLVAVTTPAIADDLRCYKIKDPQTKAKYVADIRGITAEPGCTIKVPATTVCVPATTTDLTPTPPGSPNIQTFNGFACYQTKCPNQKPKKIPSNVRVDDRFGDRSVTPSASKLLCVPVDTPIFSCGQGPFPQCGGTCPDGQACQGFSTFTGQIPMCVSESRCRCVDPATACLGAPCPSRLCTQGSCGGSGCLDCTRAGGVCASDEDCCLGNCFKTDRDDPTGTCLE